MRVTRRVAAGAVFDEHALDALAGNVRQLVLVNEGHLDVLRLRCIREDTTERQGGDKQRTEDAFHGALCSGRRMSAKLKSGSIAESGRGAHMSGGLSHCRPLIIVDNVPPESIRAAARDIACRASEVHVLAVGTCAIN